MDGPRRTPPGNPRAARASALRVRLAWHSQSCALIAPPTHPHNAPHPALHIQEPMLQSDRHLRFNADRAAPRGRRSRRVVPVRGPGSSRSPGGSMPRRPARRRLGRPPRSGPPRRRAGRSTAASLPRQPRPLARAAPPRRRRRPRRPARLRRLVPGRRRAGVALHRRPQIGGRRSLSGSSQGLARPNGVGRPGPGSFVRRRR
jgi:hypothetical protein